MRDAGICGAPSRDMAARGHECGRASLTGAATGMYRICLAMLIAAIAVNERFGANYLFLRALPLGTPFESLNAYPGALRALAALALAVGLSYAKMNGK